MTGTITTLVTERIIRINQRQMIVPKVGTQKPQLENTRSGRATERQTIARYITRRWFGYVRGDDNLRYLFHKSALTLPRQFETLQVGDTVTFRRADAGYGRRAERVQKVARRTSGEAPTRQR
jgi:hypothetical protein